jgi:hypothetical protein
MLKIQCPECKKSFLWTDDMPAEGKCPNTDCDWQYNINSALKNNIEKREDKTAKPKSLSCPFCNKVIFSRLCVCRHCGHIVLGNKVFKKSYFFVAICLILILLSLILKYMVK